jgi:Uri superfamily endonuclease
MPERPHLPYSIPCAVGARDIGYGGILIFRLMNSNDWTNFKASKNVRGCVKGVYCLLIYLASDQRLVVGALGEKKFKLGYYVYVGSAMGGIGQRVRRHKSLRKKLRWHVDYLLAKAEIIASIAIHSDSKRTECETVEAISACEDAEFPVPHFGSSDCRCCSHLIYFGDADPSMITEMLVMRLSLLKSPYPRTFD